MSAIRDNRRSSVHTQLWFTKGMLENPTSLKKLEFSEEDFDENTVETFLNILFDSAAVQQNNLKIKNIYTGVVPDPVGAYGPLGDIGDEECVD